MASKKKPKLKQYVVSAEVQFVVEAVDEEDAVNQIDPLRIEEADGFDLTSVEEYNEYEVNE